jgi:vancomycin permeability regulator SanA
MTAVKWRVAVAGALLPAFVMAVIAGLAYQLEDAVVTRASGRMSPPQSAPPTPIAIVLGAPPGRLLDARMEAACALTVNGRVSRLLLSGMPLEIPVMLAHARRCLDAGAILIDDAAPRTLSSLVRARDLHGVTEALVVSQAFHLPRTLYLADALGLRAHGVIAAGEASAWVALRERFALLRAALDVRRF